MKLVEALQILRTAPARGAEPFRVFLVCGGTPGHLQTLLTAHLQQLTPRRVELQTGLFGDCPGSLGRLLHTKVDAAAVVLEWSDFDPRLGLRHLGGWRPQDLPDILQTVRQRAAHYRDAIARAAGHAPVALCLPTLPLPPLFHQSDFQAGALELEMRDALAGFAAEIGQGAGVRVVSSQRLDQR